MTDKSVEQMLNISELPNFSLEMLEKSNEKFTNIKEVAITTEVDGEDKAFKVEMYKVFSPIKIKECIVEYIKNTQIARNIDRDMFGEITEPYLFYLFIKHFTLLGDNMPNDFKKQLLSLEHMINTGVLFQILVHFDEQEVERVKGELEQALQTFEDNYGLIEAIKEEAKYVIENEGMID